MQTLWQAPQLGRGTRLFKGRSSRQKSKTPKCSRVPTTYAFLNQTFPSVGGEALYKSPYVNLIEDSFYSHLQYLADSFRFRPKNTRHLGYPENINTAFENAVYHMNKKCPSAILIISESDNGSIGLSLVHEFDTGMTLYYVPMDILMRLHETKNSAAFWLLISCYAYLHQCAGMPLCGAYSYVDDCYQMTEDAMNDCFEEDEYSECLFDLKRMKRCTKVLNPLLKDPSQLTSFEKRIQSFKPCDKRQKEFLKSAKQIFTLFKSFPTRSFRENNSGELIHADADQIGYIEMYFSFCWTIEGWMIEQLVEYANCALGEAEFFDQPVFIQTFSNKLESKKPDFEFEKRLVTALDKLIYSINLLI